MSETDNTDLPMLTLAAASRISTEVSEVSIEKFPFRVGRLGI